MNNLLQANVQAHGDMVRLKELLKRFPVNNYSVEVDHYAMQSIVSFSIDQHKYQLRVPVGTSYNQLDYYLKEQLPELFI